MAISTIAFVVSLLSPGLQFLVSPVLFSWLFVPPVLASPKEVLKLGIPGVLLPVAGSGYRSLATHPLSIPGCARRAEIGYGSYGVAKPFTGVDTSSLSSRSSARPLPPAWMVYSPPRGL